MAEPASVQHRGEALAATLPPLLVAAERVATTVAQGVHGRRRVGQGETFWQFRQYEPGDAATASIGAKVPNRSASMSARPNGRRRRASGCGATLRPRWITAQPAIWPAPNGPRS